MEKSAIIENALALEPDERREVAEVLWDSVAAYPDEIPLTDEQKAELDLRMEEHRRDPAAGSSWEQVKARILNRQ